MFLKYFFGCYVEKTVAEWLADYFSSLGESR